MRHSLLTFAFISLATVLFAQNNTNDEIAIKKVIQQQEAAWNKHDWEAFSRGAFQKHSKIVTLYNQ